MWNELIGHMTKNSKVYMMSYTVEGIRAAQEEWEYIYNHERPHQALGYLTPSQFLDNHYPSYRKENVSLRC